MEIILEKQTITYSSLISSFSVCTTANAERLVWNLTTITAGLVDVYRKSEVDTLITGVTLIKRWIIAIDNQTDFDMWQQVTTLKHVTRNGIDLDPNIFTINSPFFQYNASMNWNSNMVAGDIIIFNFV